VQSKYPHCSTCGNVLKFPSDNTRTYCPNERCAAFDRELTLKGLTEDPPPTRGQIDAPNRIRQKAIELTALTAVALAAVYIIRKIVVG
jgi:hypothetical protein